MKGLREFVVFDCEAFFKDKSLCYLSHTDWYDYDNGKKTDKVLGVTIELVIGDDNTTYKSNETNNSFEKVRIKLPLSSSELDRLSLKKLQQLRFKSLQGIVYGEYSDKLSLKAEGVLIVNKKD